jgi:predicted PurR-regulated permease PerM
LSDVHSRPLLIVLVVAAVFLTAVIARPFWEALFLAAVLAAALHGPMEWLAVRLGGRRSVAAAILTLGLLLVVLVPLATLGAVLFGQIADGIQWVREVIQSEGVRGLVDRLPAALQHALEKLLQLMPEPERQLRSLAGQQGGTAAAAVGGILAATGGLLLQTAMMLIALFFLLTDGARLIAWLDESVPLRPGQVRTLLSDFRQTSISVLLATVGTAGIQSLVGLAGYLIARAPNPLFLTLVTFVLALVPAAGASIVVVAVGLLLLATGHVLAGGFLVIWGAAVVSVSDNVARPFLLKGGMELHGGLVFFSLLGALAVFGGIGLVVGPLVLTFLVAVAKLYRTEFRIGQPEVGQKEPPAPAAGA